MSRLILLIVGLSFSIISFGYSQRRVPVPDAPYRVSIIKLLANPDFYHGKKVAVKGYLHHKFEDASIYFVKEHADYIIAANGFWLRYSSSLADSVDLKSYDEEYVDIIGIFNKDEFGHMGSYAGVIEDVTVIRKLTPHYRKRHRRK